MRKSILFRSLTVFLAAATLLSSTSAYNLLVYANQELVSSSLSATDDEQAYEPNITIQGGELQLETNVEGEPESDKISWGTDANGIPADGSQQNPYQISSVEHFLQVNEMVNDSTGSVVAKPNNKYFVLTADIDLSSLTAADFINDTGSAYFVSTDHKNSNSDQVYINLDGSYVDENGDTQRHKITGGNSGWNIEISGHQNAAIFGYLSDNSVVQNIIFENININATVANPRQVAVIANKNDGIIQNCSVNNCSVTSALGTNHSDPYYINDGVNFYNGVAAAVTDNGGTVKGVSVNDITITLKGEDDYIGAVVAQNRGLADGCSVSGIKVAANVNNRYIGGIAGYNEPDSDELGVQNCQVDMPGANGTTQNFTKGAYVGGLVGSNDGYIYNSSVTGSYPSSKNPTATAYNILGNVTYASEDITYYGGAAGISTGKIVNVTVSDVGFYFSANTSTLRAYYGGITSTVNSASSIVNCVATGSFVSDSNANVYAGGVIGYAGTGIADAAIVNTYTLYHIDNPTKAHVGAVIGWGGKAATLSGCYWSDQVSGCSTSYIQTDAVHTDLIAGADAVTGNLVSNNKAVVAVRNISSSISRLTLTHSWAGSGVVFDLPASDITAPTSGANNSLAKAPYTVKATFPAGIGASDKSVMDVGFNVDVFVTTALGDPDDASNPMIISSSAQAKYLYLAPYGHYKLTQNISVSSSASWEAPVFTGTIDGNGKTITTDTKLFAAVIGSRAGDIGSALDTTIYATNPANDNTDYLKKGYIKNLNVDLSENITSAVFGDLINVTFVDVALTDGDIAEDDGNDTTFDGFYATFTSKRQATFASSANGYSYIYGCSTDVSAYVREDGQEISYNDQAIFIAKLTGETTVDNCYINANIYICAGLTANTGRAAFIGDISENTGYILNSAVNTRVIYYVSGLSVSHCTVIFGKMDSVNNNYGKYKNLVWSKSEPTAVLYPSSYSYDNSQIILWGAATTAGGSSYPEKTVSQGVSASFSVKVPGNIKAFENTKVSDFFVSADNGDTSAFEIVSVSLDDSVLSLIVRAKDDAAVDSREYIRIYHQPSGLTTFVRAIVKESGLTYNAEDGFYHITTAADIKFIADNFANNDPNLSGRKYAQAAYILDNDIDMTGVTIRPIGSASIPFTGVFIGPTDENGEPLYTISNLTVESETSNSGFFGVVDFSGEDMVLGTDSVSYERGISNIAITGATVTGADNVAVLVGYAFDSVTTDKIYGKTNIKNIIIRDSVVTAGEAGANTGKSAAAVLAYAYDTDLNITSVKVERVRVESYYYSSTPYYFVAETENSNNRSGGLGGVVGSIQEYQQGYDYQSAMSVNISDIDISGLELNGTNIEGVKTYAPLNAGGIVGAFFTIYTASTTVYATMNIGNLDYTGDGYDINVEDSIIMVSGNAGGVLGATNVKTTINSARVYGSKSPVGAEADADIPMQIHGKTDYFVGGIAGYIGSKVRDDNNAYDNAPLTIVYGTVKNCLVENADVRAIATSSTVQLTRNVTVGGVVGAINGHKDSNAVSNSIVKNSHIEGIVVGGIVGSSIDTNGTRISIVTNNSLNVDLCSVYSSEITTIKDVIPCAEVYTKWLAYGVGGIVGTNKRNLYSYAQHTTIQRCLVDDATVITNSIPGSIEGVTGTFHSTTGGVIGSGFENHSSEGKLVVKYNEVYTSIISKSNLPSVNSTPDQKQAFHQTLSATGGLVGSLIGNQNRTTAPSANYYEICELSKISIEHNVFGGSILGTDGIGGAIGVIAAASAYTADNPSNLLSDIAITGTLKSTLDNSVYRGGIAIGHIAIKSNGVDSSSNSTFYAFDVAAGTNITSIFNKIYFSSFGIDTSLFPVFGYNNATNATNSADYSPLASNAQVMLIECYEDVNKKDDNSTKQFSDAESAVDYVLPSTSYPLATRPTGADGAYSVTNQKWYGSNATIAEIVSSGPNDLTVKPLNSGTISVMIDYVGTVGDSTWSVEAHLPVGFRFKSNNQTPLDNVTVDGVTYYLITNPYDFAILGKNMTDADNMGNFDETHMALNYWITNDIELPEDMFTTDGFYDGGFASIGTYDIPFTGVLSSMPEGTYVSVNSKEYVSDGYNTISGMEIAASTHMGLFAYVKGATFENFAIDDFVAKGTDATSYLGTLSAVVKNNVTVNNVALSNINLTESNYAGGFFGGILYEDSTEESELTDISVEGSVTDDVYSNIISARFGAAGVVVHTSHYNTNITNVAVRDIQIIQHADMVDTLYYNYGAAGISMAYSGKISADENERNIIEGCKISGENAAGAVSRSYLSEYENEFVSPMDSWNFSEFYPIYRAQFVEINSVDVKQTSIASSISLNDDGIWPSNDTFIVAAGVLARVDASFVEHRVTNSVVNNDVYISSPMVAGGIVGCYKSPIDSYTGDMNQYYLTIDGCESYATVELTDTTSAPTDSDIWSSNTNVGAGAVLGSIGAFCTFINTDIKNSVAGGVICGYGNMGGIVGVINSQNNYWQTIDWAQNHFIENCVISAEFKTKVDSEDYQSAFSTNIKGVGLVVGNVWGVTDEFSDPYLYPYLEEYNYPFYNIYFSDIVYNDEENVRIFGYAIDAFMDGTFSLSDTDKYPHMTKYVYNLNKTNTYTIDNENGYVLIFTDDTNRISVNGNVESEKHIFKLNYNFIQGGQYTFSTDAFGFDASVISSDNFVFDSAASVNGFTVTADTEKGAVVSADAESTEFVLEKIASSDSRITISPVGDSTTEYSVTSVPLTSGVSGQLYFHYTNGLTLSVGLEIEIKPEDFWFKVREDNVEDLLIFNAANLSFVKNRASATSVITQCYDVYWTLSDSSVIAAASAAIAGKKLSDVYSSEFIAALAEYKHPNPYYDGTAATEQYVTFDKMFNTTAATRGDVLLSELVGEIGNISFETYGEDTGASVYSRSDAFTGTYKVETAVIDTGITSVGDTYKIYGFELRSNNVTANDVVYTGMFNRIGAGATVSNVTFVNPVINTVNSQAASNYVGVLAGDITGATVNDITVTEMNGNSYVSSVRRMTAANTYVGAVAGYIGAGTTVNGVKVSGVDVIGASTAGNRASTANAIKYVYVGGVAGSSDGTLNDVSIDNVSVFANRNESYARGYISYAGGVAGQASGKIVGKDISVLVSGCDITVNVDDDDYATVEYAANASSEAGDRLGGVVGLASGSLDISGANLVKVQVNAFDIAGGVIAEIVNDAAAVVTVSGCDIGSDENKASVTMTGTSNITGETYGRVFYNAVGGVVGFTDNVALLRITDCDFNGFAGQYELEHKNCTAGGIIGYVGEKLASLDSIVISASTVQGEVAGYRRAALSESASLRILGAAGGIIGKIYNFAHKTFDNTDKMISDSVMSAKVNLYDSINGTTVKADYATLENVQSDPNVGKIIGEIRAGDNFAKTAGNADNNNVTFGKYVSNVYVSSYPQNIVVYGSSAFYNNNLNDPKSTYIDINKENRYMSSEAEGPEDVSSFMVDSTIADSTVEPDSYDTGTYSDVAIITFDENGTQQGTVSSRYFRLAYDNIKLNENVDKTIEFSEQFAISVEDSSIDLSDVSVSANFYDNKGLTETVDSTHSYSYHPGVITLTSNKNVDIVGYISAKYNYGLEAGIQFVSMEIAGNGSESNPFQIAQPKHLKVVRALRGAYYKQVANIDFANPLNDQYSSATPGALFADGKGIEPIGQSSAPFTGSYDGDGFILSNVYIARPDEDNVGFFGYIGTGNNRATLKNIHIELASELDITDENSVVTTVVGGVTGRENVGGLVGYANNADIINCSVADGFVMGKTKVGGLVGRAGSVGFDSCYTATSTYSYLTSTGSGSTKSVGALVGNTTGTVSIIKSFTLGLASVGTTSTSGVAGGLVGYAGSGTLSIGDSLVGATVSNYDSIKDGDDVTYTGMTVGQAANILVTADKIIVAATNTFALSDRNRVNPVLGGTEGASVTNIYVDTDLVGNLNGSEAYNTDASYSIKDENGLYRFNVSEAAAADAYTAAYVALAVIPVTVDSNEVKDRDTYKNPGLYYPLTLNHGGGYTFTTSVIDQTDTVAYPDGLDEELYGNVTDSGNDKNTDLLFRDDNGITTVYPNVFSRVQGEVLSDGSVHSNDEIAYDSTMPYFNVSKSVDVKNSSVEITRKIVYPQQNRTSTHIATARQFFALTNKVENADGSKFYDFYTLNGKAATLNRNYTVVADIDLGANNFTPIVGYTGTFDGNGYTVDNLVINMPGSNEVGLFRTLSSATVKNLTLGVYQITGNNNVGGLVGAIITQESGNITFNAMVQIENCHVIQSEGGSGISATGKNVGGLVGAATRSLENSDIYLINNSSSAANVSGYDVVGGLVGYCEQPVRNSYSTGSVNAQFTSASTVTEIHPWYVNGSSAITAAPLNSSAQHGAGGVVGVLCNSESTNNVAKAEVSYSFGSGIVNVTDASYAQGSVYGVGGLVGVSCEGTIVDTSFSSGNVYYCYGNTSFASCSSTAVGVGGLVGINYSDLNNVYSSASVAADFGDVTGSTAVGAGGVAGVAYAKISSSYSSGATLGTTTTADYSGCNYGMGGVIGVLDYNADECANLIFDLNLSITDKVAGKILNGRIQENNSGARTTKYLTTKPETEKDEFMSLQFGYVEGAYPYLKAFFNNNVSLVIRINALLSIVALQLNELDTSAASGNGISMALNIPTEFEYIASGTDDSANAGKYAYGYSDENGLIDAAQGVIDTVTNTLSIQRTVNEAQYVNFVITVASKDNNTVADDGTPYSQVANRLVSRLCAPMLGTDTHPYLVATQEDLKHVGMTNSELQSATGMYKQWATPILENGTATSGPVNFRLMGYVPLDGYNRTIADLTGQTYSVDGKSITYEGITFDGNGYSIRNLQTRLFTKLDSSSKLSNMTFEGANFNSSSLIGSLFGTVEGVNVFGTASGSNTAAIANIVEAGGKIIGSLANVDYVDTVSSGNVAGVAVTNNGEIRMSASVGNFSGSAVSGLGGLVVDNNGTILDSFTIGNITFTGDATNLGGFVNNNTGSITNCYTRCNIDIAANTAERIIASFAAQNSGTIKSAYSSGMLKLGVKTNPYSVFVAKSTGTLTDCMFDKQMSGSQFSDIYTLAERTLDIVNLTNHTGMISTNTLTAYETKTPDIIPSDDVETAVYHNIYYPQLKSILNTEEYETQGEGDDATQVETVRSRMYSALRAYSFISSATALVANDNYIDNLAYTSKTPLSYDSVNSNLWSRTGGSDSASVTFYGTAGAGINGRHILAGSAQGDAVISAKYAANSFYGLKLDDAQLDLFVKVTDGAHPNFAGGNGTEEKPYIISTDKQFVGLAFYGTNPDGHFILGNDIDMSNAVWTNYIDNFKANLDGDNKALYNVTIGESGNDSLFGMINGGKIGSLGVAGIDVAVTGSSGGMLASSATNGAEIANTYVVGTLNTSKDSAQTNIGGLVGEIDGSVIDGCVVSGKIVSDASYTGGVVGSALDGSAIRNTLSTVYVDGGEGTAAGVVGTVSGTVDLKSCVFASDVKGATKGNIVGDGSAGDNCYYDKQMSSVVDNANGVSTHYLTGGATIKQLGFVDGENATMSNIEGFTGYPVPVGMVSGSDKFLAGIKFASAKINLASGAGAGTLNSFTAITAPSALGTGISAKLVFSIGEGETAYLVNVNDTQINTDTATLALGDIVNRNVTYTVADGGFDGGKMVRYLDLYVGKTLKVTYNYVGLDPNANAVLTAYSGMSNVSAVTAFAVSGKHNGTLCSSMVVPYDAEQGAYILRVDSELPQDKAINTVSATVNLKGTASNDITVKEEKLADGIWKLAFEPNKNADGETIPVDCDEIVITVNLAEAPWGVHQYLNLF